MTTEKSTYATLVAVDVSRHVEKKNGFSYLSWSHALHELLVRFPDATWGHDEWGPADARVPYVKAPGKGYLVRAWCEVNGVRRSVQHAVTDHSNRPIEHPTCADISNSIQRATVKAIALHGLGLSVYAGEDLPADPAPPPSSPAGASKATRSAPRGQQRSQGEGRSSALRGAGRSPLTIDQRIAGALDSLGITGDVSRWHAVTKAAGVPPDVEELTEEQKQAALAGLIERYRAKQARSGGATE